jgi:hypothetical protein
MIDSNDYEKNAFAEALTLVMGGYAVIAVDTKFIKEINVNLSEFFNNVKSCLSGDLQLGEKFVLINQRDKSIEERFQHFNI